MASYSTPSSSPPPSPGSRRVGSCARRCERGCCLVATYFPLAFVYGLTTWAVWVVWSIGFGGNQSTHGGALIRLVAVLGIVLYGLANASYTIAVFTDPGSPTQSGPAATTKQGTYTILPTHEPAGEVGRVHNITVSSTGAPRYCKKCHTPKPDRTHHCSTCQRCVLKMDHHCPWLSTCVGLHNYKAFVLFLIYTSLFAWACLACSAWWMWKELFEQSGYLEEAPSISIILLSVISGIIGLVLSAFTGWHLYLCALGQTTIEKLEKTRYLSAVRRRVERNRQDQQWNHRRRMSEGVAERLQRAGEQILEFHANAVPGASRFEEGEEHTSPVASVHNTIPTSALDRDTPAVQALRQTYSALEAERERDRYAEYLDDRDSDKMPNAFDLGWRRNLLHLFGPRPLLWCLPVCNTTGDGWRWEVSDTWMLAHEDAVKRRERRLAAIEGRDDIIHSQGRQTRQADRYERSRDHDDDDAIYPHNALSMQVLAQQGMPSHRGPQDPLNHTGHTDARGRVEERPSFEDAGLDYDDVDDVEAGWDRRRHRRKGLSPR